jgi:hypothetical protein
MAYEEHRVLPLLLMLLVQAPRGEVDTTVDKKVDFSAFRTYSWERGREAYVRPTHEVIVNAIDAEMAGLGFTNAEAAKAQVVIKYHTVCAADVGLDVLEKRQKEGKTDPAPTSILGVLMVEMRAADVRIPSGRRAPAASAALRDCARVHGSRV